MVGDESQSQNLSMYILVSKYIRYEMFLEQVVTKAVAGQKNIQRESDFVSSDF